MTLQSTRAERRVHLLAAPVVALLVLATAAACGGDDEPAATATGEADPASTDPSSTDPSRTDPASTPATPLEGTLRLGFFPNVTHAPALVGVDQGLFQAALGDGVELETFTFNAGTEAAEALFAEAIDISFIGPNPAITAFAESDGQAIRIISGSTSGGAFLVVKPEITSVEQLAGTTLASPSLGNTQDVALRAWLKDNGFETTLEGGGDVTILPQSNATTLDTFVAGDIDGAWVPEPWATRLIEEGGGTVLVDERDLWTDTGGEFVTTHVVVRTAYLEQHPDIVTAFLHGLVASLDSIEADPAAAQASVVGQIATITAQDTDPATIAASWKNLTFTVDPIAAALRGSADDATEIGVLDPVDLTGIYDLTLLNDVLAERGEPAAEGF